MNKSELIKHYNKFLKEHKLKPEEFIVCSGGACLMYGIRKETNDMDMGVSKEFFDKMLRTDMYTTHTFKGWFPTLQVAIEYSDIIDLHVAENKSVMMIDGVCCYSVETTLSQKLAMNREKDQNDIKLLKGLLIKNNFGKQSIKFKPAFMR